MAPAATVTHWFALQKCIDWNPWNRLKIVLLQSFSEKCARLPNQTKNNIEHILLSLI